MKEEAKQILIKSIEEWEEAGAIGHIVLSLLPGKSDEIGDLHYFTFGPEPGTPEQEKLTMIMDRILDQIGERKGKN